MCAVEKESQLDAKGEYAEDAVDATILQKK
jgi:hypothetical protein